MDWPARSPDLNPIKHVWDFLGRRLAARTLPPVTIQGCGSPMIKVSDHGRYDMSSSPVPLKIRRVGHRCSLNLSRAETSSFRCGAVVRRGVLTQVSTTSLDNGSKLLDPSLKALV
ncbi:uncharacterized protein TNCV_244801 [Trichonephila clavipes]|uniref:Uncharacterized protein n=1 Tax=Trichonephila clavipes TaxID=2585209 RepID=A0A8X6V6W6_TRICX|nr:uncharacterized protein TNCV_244801 [Trichonephila clavipes]